jgi:hypothetical protein
VFPSPYSKELNPEQHGRSLLSPLRHHKLLSSSIPDFEACKGHVSFFLFSAKLRRRPPMAGLSSLLLLVTNTPVYPHPKISSSRSYVFPPFLYQNQCGTSTWRFSLRSFLLLLLLYFINTSNHNRYVSCLPSSSLVLCHIAVTYKQDARVAQKAY